MRIMLFWINDQHTSGITKLVYWNCFTNSYDYPEFEFDKNTFVGLQAQPVVCNADIILQKGFNDGFCNTQTASKQKS